jgi:hypothetical protein
MAEMNRISVTAILVAATMTSCQTDAGRQTHQSSVQGTRREPNRFRQAVALAVVICIESALYDQVKDGQAQEDEQINEDRARIRHRERPKYHEDELALSYHESELYWRKKEPLGMERLWKKPVTRPCDVIEADDISEQTNPRESFEPLTIEQLVGEISIAAPGTITIPSALWATEPITEP